jgi:hypothetical protein
LKRKSKKRDIGNEIVDATLHGRVWELASKLNASDHEKYELESTLCGRVSELEAKLNESDREKNELEHRS